MTNIEGYENTLRGLVAALRGTETRLSMDLSHLKFERAKADQSEAERDTQVVINALENLVFRVENARRILDQSAVLICQDGADVMVVTRIDDRTREIIRLAESRGGRVVSIEKAEEEIVI